MKKLAFILAIALSGSMAVTAANSIQPTASAYDVVMYCKVINNTSSPFEYKVGSDVYTITVGNTGAFAFEEGTQIMKKDTNGNWVNWFVFGAAQANQTINLTDLLSI